MNFVIMKPRPFHLPPASAATRIADDPAQSMTP